MANANAFDTKPPLNSNDEDVHVTAESLPQHRLERKDSTISLVKCATMLLLPSLTAHNADHTISPCTQSLLSCSEKLNLISDLEKNFQTKHLIHSSRQEPLVIFTNMFARSQIVRMGLMVEGVLRLPVTRHGETSGLADDARAELCLLCLSLLDDHNLMTQLPAAMP